MREPPGRAGVGGQRVRRALAGAHRLADPFQPNERRAGIGRERQRGCHDREDVPDDLAQSRVGVHDAGEHVVAAGGLGEAQPFEQLFRRGTVDPGPGLRRTRERLQQRPVEEPLVDPSDQRRGPVVLTLQRRGVGEAERTRERRARRGAGREVVRLQVAHHLEPVLQPPEKAIRVGQHVRVGRRDVPLRGQGRERREGVRRAERRVTPSVHDLEQLDRELDVADASAPALDLGQLLATLPDVFLEPNLRPANLVDRRRLQTIGIHEWLDPRDEGLA